MENIKLNGKRLGKRLPRHDERTLMFAKYARALPAPPTNSGYTTKISTWGMMLNDSLGDCTCACAGHEIMQWTTYAGKPFTPTDAQILAAYEAVSGYVPGQPNTDNGAVITNVLNYFRQTGIAGHKIVAYVAINMKNHTEVMQAVEIFGNVYIGVGLPVTAQTPGTGLNGLPLWAVPPGGPVGNGAPYSWGGHAIPIVAYGTDSAGNKGTQVVTWGAVYDVSWGFLDLYCDEGYAIVTQDFLESDGSSPSGFDVAELLADLKTVAA